MNGSIQGLMKAVRLQTGDIGIKIDEVATLDAWKIFVDWGKKEWINKTMCYCWTLVIDMIWEERIWEVSMASHSSLVYPVPFSTSMF